MKETVADVRTLMLSVDPGAAAYPWELMRDSDQADEASAGDARRTGAPTGHGPWPGEGADGGEKRVFIVGDTQSGMMELPGAQAEARTVAERIRGQGL